MDFSNAYAQGFVRVAAQVVPIKLAQPAANAAAIVEDLRALSADAVAVVTYPRACLTGATCGDLRSQGALLDAAEEALAAIVEASADLLPLIVVGVPLRYGPRVFDCAAVVQAGDLLGVVPLDAPGVDELIELPRVGLEADFTPNQTFACTDIPDLVVYVGTGNWDEAVRQGATVLVEPTATPAVMGGAAVRRRDGVALSARVSAAYVTANAGMGESTTNASWDGQAYVAECGDLLDESALFADGAVGVTADVDLVRIGAGRTGAPGGDAGWTQTAFTLDPPGGDLGLRRAIDPYPFVPSDPDALPEAYSIQVTALAQRLAAIGTPKPVLGVSGGLDSTWALVVCAGALDRLGRPRSDLLAFTMPGFATSEGTKNHALALMKAVGATAETIDIRPAARQILTDLGHPFAAGEPVYDVTFENVQAGVRADYLFRLANQRGGLVIGTGDLSELALGWCTYGVGDHMSHYGVNAGVTKTLIRALIGWAVDTHLLGEEAGVEMAAILEQEVSPELVPPADGRTLQSTESQIGPYALHDFFLYHLLSYGARPSRIAYLARQAFAGDRLVNSDLTTVVAWLTSFLKRFFAQQFKRSAMPDGPVVSPAGTLSPRSWRMPSDASPTAWLAELTNAIGQETR